MEKVIRLTENDLVRIVKKVIKEQSTEFDDEDFMNMLGLDNEKKEMYKGFVIHLKKFVPINKTRDCKYQYSLFLKYGETNKKDFLCDDCKAGLFYNNFSVDKWGDSKFNPCH